MTNAEMPGPASGRGPTHDRILPVQTITAHGCIVVLRSAGQDLFIHGRPGSQLRGADAGRQAEAVYRAIVETLCEAVNSQNPVILSEAVFHRDLRTNLEAVRTARRQVLEAIDTDLIGVAATEIEQPPVEDHACLEVQLHAVAPTDQPLQVSLIRGQAACHCIECARAQGLNLSAGDDSLLYSGVLYGRGDTAYEQTLDLFAAAHRMLEQAGMTFKHVARTWIYLEHMTRDYPLLNRARREVFEEHGVFPPPASTGIGARVVPVDHDLCMSFVAIRGESSGAGRLSPMATPTLNEAPRYGADFSRGMRVARPETHTLFVSGTASLNEDGQSVHGGDFDAQVDRMLLNVASLLNAQGSGFADIVSATTYVKNRADAKRLEQKFVEAGYVGFPNALVEAPVCRPELLCETEALAIVPVVDR